MCILTPISVFDFQKIFQVRNGHNIVSNLSKFEVNIFCNNRGIHVIKCPNFLIEESNAGVTRGMEIPLYFLLKQPC